MTGSKSRAGGASLLTLFLVVLTGMIGFGLFIPIFPFLALSLNGSATEITLAMGAYSLGQLISAPGWGRLSDHVGRKPVLIIGLCGAAVSYLMIAYATSVEMMGLARLFGGLMAGNVGAAFAAATDLADDATRTKHMGVLGAAFALGFIFGPAIGAVIVGGEPSAQSFQLACFAAAGFATLAAVAASFLFRETLPVEARRSREAPRVRRSALLASRPVLAQLVLVTLLMIAAQALMESTFGLWSDRELGWGARETGIAFAALGVLTVALQGGGAGRLASVIGERRMLIAGLALFALGFACMALARDAVLAGAGIAFLAIGGGMASPALNSLVAAEAHETDRGAVMGLNQSASALGRVIGPAASGFIFDGLGHAAPFTIGAVVLLFAIGLAILAAPRPQRA